MLSDIFLNRLPVIRIRVDFGFYMDDYSLSIQFFDWDLIYTPHSLNTVRRCINTSTHVFRHCEMIVFKP